MKKHGQSSSVICTCGTTFYVPHSRIASGRGKFCCRRCFLESKERHDFYNLRSVAMAGNKLGLGNTGYWLGKRMPDSVKKKMRLSAKRGENSHMWRGGRTVLRKAIRSLAQYKDWRMSIFNRDGFSCSICHNKPGYVEADHFPESFDSILTKHGITTVESALACPSLWDVGNGRTVCRKCHESHTTQSNQRYKRHGNK